MKIYKNLLIKAIDPKTKIWLADDEGNLVQMEIGEMKTSILRGKYAVHFGLGSKGVPINLIEDQEIVENIPDADRDIREGNVEIFNSVDDMIASLKKE